MAKKKKRNKKAVPNRANKSIPGNNPVKDKGRLSNAKGDVNDLLNNQTSPVMGKKEQGKQNKRNKQVKSNMPKEKGVNEGILENFINDMYSLMERVRVSGLVKNDKVYITESELKESLDNYLSVFGNLDEDGYLKRFNERLEEFNIYTDTFEGSPIYFVTV